MRKLRNVSFLLMVATIWLVGPKAGVVHARTVECVWQQGTCAEADECTYDMGGYASQAACLYQAQSDCIGRCQDAWSEPIPGCGSAVDVGYVYVDWVDSTTCHVYCGCRPGVGCEECG